MAFQEGFNPFGGIGKSSGNGSGSSTYELPIASADTLGGVKVGDGLAVTEQGVLSASGGGSGAQVVAFSVVPGTEAYSYVLSGATALCDAMEAIDDSLANAANYGAFVYTCTPVEDTTYKLLLYPRVEIGDNSVSLATPFYGDIGESVVIVNYYLDTSLISSPQMLYKITVLPVDSNSDYTEFIFDRSNITEQDTVILGGGFE